MSCGVREPHREHLYVHWSGETRDCEGVEDDGHTSMWDEIPCDDCGARPGEPCIIPHVSDDEIHQSASWHEHEMTGESY
jgi:hypothetical protein